MASAMRFQKQLKRIQKDLRLFSKISTQNGLFSRKHVNATIESMEILISQIAAWVESAASKKSEIDGTANHLLRVLCDKLAFSEWAIWAQNETSITFLRVHQMTGKVAVDSCVTFHFYPSTDFKTVAIHCQTDLLKSQFKTIVESSQLADTVFALLKSFQPTIVWAKRWVNQGMIKCEDLQTLNGSAATVTKLEGNERFTKEPDDQIHEVKLFDNGLVVGDYGDEGDEGDHGDNQTETLNGNDSDLDCSDSLGDLQSDGEVEYYPPRVIVETAKRPKHSKHCDIRKFQPSVNDSAAKGEDSGEIVNDGGDATELVETETTVESDKECDPSSSAPKAKTPRRKKHDEDFVPPSARKSKKQSSTDSESNDKTITSKAPQRCRLCQALVRISHVASHLAQKHDIHDFVCCFCPKKFENHIKRYRHIHMYHPPRPAKSIDCQPCKECQLFITKRESVDHMEIEHGKRDECPFCPFKVGDEDLSRLHTIEFACQSNTRLTGRRKLKTHISKSHRTSFGCGRCGVNFTSKETLIEHRKRDLKDSERTVEPCKKINYEPPTTICNLCGRKTRSMVVHMATAHSDKPGDYECSFCQKRFNRPKDLRKHVAKLHLPQMRHKCGICGKTFSDNEALKLHRKIHDEPSIKCPQCDKLFKWKSNVIQHLRGCHYPPKYECLPCGQRFHHKPAARMHLDKQHHLQQVEEFIKVHAVDMGADLALIAHLKF